MSPTTLWADSKLTVSGAAMWTAIIAKDDWLKIVKVEHGALLGIYTTAGASLCEPFTTRFCSRANGRPRMGVVRTHHPLRLAVCRGVLHLPQDVITSTTHLVFSDIAISCLVPTHDPTHYSWICIIASKQRHTTPRCFQPQPFFSFLTYT